MTDKPRFQFSLGILLAACVIVGLFVGLLLSLRKTESLKAEIAFEKLMAERARVATEKARAERYWVATHLEHHLHRVINGHTIEIEYGGKRQIVRLLGIDAPSEGKPNHSEAADALAKLLGESKGIKLDFEKDDLEERDREGRLLAYVLVGTPNGYIKANVEMVRQGHAKF